MDTCSRALLRNIDDSRSGHRNDGKVDGTGDVADARCDGDRLDGEGATDRVGGRGVDGAERSGEPMGEKLVDDPPSRRVAGDRGADDRDRTRP